MGKGSHAVSRGTPCPDGGAAMDAGIKSGGRWPQLGGTDVTGRRRQEAGAYIGQAVIAPVPAPAEHSVSAAVARAQIDGSAPLSARREFLQRSRRSRPDWIIGAAIAILVVWLVVAAVVGIR